MTAAKKNTKPAASKSENPFEDVDFETDETVASKDPSAGTKPADAVPTSKETTPDSSDTDTSTTDAPGEDPASSDKEKPAAEPKTASRTRKSKALDHSKLPVTVITSSLQGSITLQNGRPVLKVSPRPWIGEEPLVLAENQLDDLINLLQEVKKGSR